MKTTLTAFVHGEPGVGKSWLGDSVPAPRLYLDAEGRAKYLPSGPKVVWDPLREEPPAANGWETCVVNVTDFDVLQRVYEWLRSERHCFTSVTFDSLMEIQKRCMDKIAGMNQMKTQDWGELLRRIEGLVRSYRDLTMFESNPLAVVVMVCGSRNIEGTMRPLLQGQANTTLPYYFDIVGYMFTQLTADGSQLVRRLMIQPTPGYVAKDNTGGRLPGIVDAPNISTMLEALRLGGKPESIQTMQEVQTQ